MLPPWVYHARARNTAERKHVPQDDLSRPADADTDAALRAAGVVHDVNQMLTVISGRTELLLRRAPEHREHLQAIRLAAADAAGMLARLGPGRGGGDLAGRAATEVSSVVEAALGLVLPPDGGWAPAGAGAGWEVELALLDSAAMAVPAAVLREVLVNLLCNALAVLPQGGRLVFRSAVDGGECRLSLADSGPGLPVADPEAVFAAGFTTNPNPGRGLGLAACRQLLAAHGARLSAERDGGPGAVFTIAAPVADVPTVRPRAAPRAATGDVRGLAVVVIDDEPAVREMLVDVLGELGCPVTCHRDGAGALAAGAPGEAVLALVDRRLPGLDGVAVAAQLRERRPGLVIALMTGWDREQVAAPPGVIDFQVSKPLALSALQELLAAAEALERARGRI